MLGRRRRDVNWPWGAFVIPVIPLPFVIPINHLCHSERSEESAVCRWKEQQIPHRLKPVRNDNCWKVADRQKPIAPLRASQPTLPMITTASNEMQLFRAVIAPGMVGHQGRLLFPAKK